MRLHTNGNQELQYQPGDHLGVFPGNHEDLVNALIERLEDAPPANQMVKVELLEERSTALGNTHTHTPWGPFCHQGILLPTLPWPQEEDRPLLVAQQPWPSYMSTRPGCQDTGGQATGASLSR